VNMIPMVIALPRKLVGTSVLNAEPCPGL
jgi:hypothetical protein